MSMIAINKLLTGEETTWWTTLSSKLNGVSDRIHKDDSTSNKINEHSATGTVQCAFIRLLPRDFSYVKYFLKKLFELFEQFKR